VSFVDEVARRAAAAWDDALGRIRDRESPEARYIAALQVDGQARTAPWLPESLARRGGRLRLHVAGTADPTWGSAPGDAPPSFPPRD